MSVRRDPFEAMERMFDQMRRAGFRDDPFGAVQQETAFDPNVSVERIGDEFVVVADLPGFEREEIDLTYADRTLTVSGVHEDRHGDGHGKYEGGDGDHEGSHVSHNDPESSHSYRSRSVQEAVTVPEDVVAEAIEATYRNGVLEVRLPVDEADPSGYHIEIN